MLIEAATGLMFAAAAAPAAGESPAGNGWTIPLEAETRVAGRGVSLPVITYTAPDGSLKMKRGIVAGVDVAPNATLGIGLYETLPKTHRLSPTDNPLERKTRRSRKAAVGFSLRF